MSTYTAQETKTGYLPRRKDRTRKQFIIRFTDREYDEVTALAREANLSVARYVITKLRLEASRFEKI